MEASIVKNQSGFYRMTGHVDFHTADGLQADGWRVDVTSDPVAFYTKRSDLAAQAAQRFGLQLSERDVATRALAPSLLETPNVRARIAQAHTVTWNWPDDSRRQLSPAQVDTILVALHSLTVDLCDENETEAGQRLAVLYTHHIGELRILLRPAELTRQTQKGKPK